MGFYYEDVSEFNDKFRLRPLGRGPLDKYMARRRADQMREELREFEDACADDDLPKAVDALVDIVYFAMGAAVMMGLRTICWSSCWNAVHKANMAKKMNLAERSNLKQGMTKPDGWVGPDAEIRAALKADGLGEKE